MSTRLDTVFLSSKNVRVTRSLNESVSVSKRYIVNMSDSENSTDDEYDKGGMYLSNDFSLLRFQVI